MRPLLLIGVLAATLLTATPAARGLTARQIVDKAMAHSYLGQEGARASVRMTLTGRRGAQRIRRLAVWSHRPGGLVRSLVRIVAPPDVAGTSFLYREGRGGNDAMWLYIPSLKRTRRIVGRARRGRFLGSDFTYADIEARALRQATYRRLPDARVGRHPCYVIEAKPKGAGSQYRKVLAWIRQKDFIAIRLKMYDQGGKLLKKLFVRRIGRSPQGRPIIKETKMANVQSGTSTLLQVLSSRALAAGAAQLFTVRNLSRGL